MIAALHMSGFEVWDVTMQDLLDEKLTLDRFRGIVFPGGFSFAGNIFHKPSPLFLIDVIFLKLLPKFDIKNIIFQMFWVLLKDGHPQFFSTKG